MTIPVIGKIVKGFVGSQGVLDSQNVEVDDTNLVGVLNGVNDTLSALSRLDGTGIGADIFTFTGAYSAQSSNITEWFGGKQLVRLRCTGRGSSPAGSLSFDLPGTTALNTAFDQLSALNISERIEFIIEYTGATDSFLNIRPRISPSPQIMGVTNIIVRSGVTAMLEITRSNNVISSYIFLDIGQISAPGTGVFDSLKLINPSTTVWDASTNGSLPTSGVVKGNAYKVINAPSDGSGRFGEVMYTDDWVVWEGETFTSWSAEPHQWFVISAHDVRRITALEQDFLTDVQITPVSDRNSVTRGANYADTAGEIRMKIYDSVGDYSAADLNTTGDIDEYTDTTGRVGVLAIRLTGTQSSLASVLPTLYVYNEDGGGTFTKLLNLDRDFTHQGDFTGESDYVSDANITYNANDTLRIYIGTDIDRYNAPNLDINEDNLSDDVQSKLNTNHPDSGLNEALTALSNQARVFNITHTDYRSNNNNVYLANSFALLKNAPTTFPNTAGAFANEITGGAFTVDDPANVTTIQDVSSLTNNVMTGAGIANQGFGINSPDQNNWRMVIGGWLYYDTIPVSFTPILRVRERGEVGTVYRNIFGIDSNGIVFKQRATTGTTVNVSIRHPLYTEGEGAAGGLTKASITSSNLSVSFRVYTAETFLVQATGRLSGVLVGGEGHDYTITNVNNSQAETTQNFDFGGNTQSLKIKYDASSTLYGGSEHIITITADSLISGIDEIEVDVLSAQTAVTTSIGNTYSDLFISEGHAAPRRLMRYIASFRSVNGVESGNLECVLTLFGYDSNGNPRVFDENTFELLYPALDLSWDDIQYGGTGIHQNIQGFFLNPDTPLFEYPRHSTLRNWLTSYDRKSNQWCWGNIHAPSQDTEAVSFPEFVNFPNLIFIDTATGERVSFSIENGAVKTEVIT